MKLGIFTRVVAICIEVVLLLCLHSVCCGLLVFMVFRFRDMKIFSLSDNLFFLFK